MNESSPSPRLSDMVVSDEPLVAAQRVGWASWLKVAILGALVVAFYWDGELLPAVNKCYAQISNWGHAFIIPLLSLYLLYIWRDELFAPKRRVWVGGLIIVILAIICKMYCAVQPQIPGSLWFRQLTILFVLWGLVLYLCGPRVAKVAFVPIFYMALAMPWPDRLYEMVSLPLQNFAAKIATALLQLCGAQIATTQSNMSVTSMSGVIHDLTVAEACSGVRSLMAFLALGVALAYVQERPTWQRVAIMLGGLPIALVVNVIRVSVTATMFVIDKPQLGQQFMHTFTGLVLLIPALLLLFLFTRVLDGFYLDDDDEDENDDESSDDEAESPQAAAAEEGNA